MTTHSQMLSDFFTVIVPIDHGGTVHFVKAPYMLRCHIQQSLGVPFGRDDGLVDLPWVERGRGREEMRRRGACCGGCRGCGSVDRI